MSHWLVTGGAGFIGSNIVESLVRRGERVRVVDNFITGRRENLADFKDEVELIEGDLREIEVCEKAVKGIDVILHQAALGSVPRSLEDPLSTHHSNVTATLNLLVAARQARVGRVVCASSASIYGANPGLPKQEEMTPMPISPYAVSKLGQEQYCLAFHAAYGMDTVALRYFNIYGPRQDPSSQYAAVVPRFIKAALIGQAPHIHGDGEQSRDFTFVGDCVEANLRAGEAQGVSGKAMNIAAGSEASVNQLWETVKRITGAEVEPVHTEPRKGDVRKSRADISLARELMGYRPAHDLESGLGKTIAWSKTKAQ